MQKGSLTGFIARKYLKYDPSLPFISITALLAFLGVAIGVMVLMIAMAIMQGMIKEFEEKLFIMNYPITVKSYFWDTVDHAFVEDIQTQFPHLIISPYVKAQGVAKSGDMMEGVMVFGVDPKKEAAINPVFAEFHPESGFERFSIMIGKSLYDELYMQNRDRLTLIFTSLEPVGLAATPLMKRFKIENTFDSGLIAYDKAYIYADVDDLRKVLRVEPNLYHGVHIRSENPMEDAQKLKEYLGDGYAVIGWWEQNSSFFAAIAMEKRALFIVLMLIILVASLNIITSLLMTVMNRRKEIALLLSLGASKKEVRRIFFTLGSVIGLSGIVAGVLLGGAGLWVLDTFDIIALPAEVYGTSKLPLELSVGDFISILSGTVVVVLLSAWYPAKKASEIDPLTVLRSE